ncbi:MAG TPA: hypothetical protein DEF65_10990 [Lachnospiraceae bacterium]|nr:hypothetical protein [Lachnospiraceae bacterium]
MVNIDLGEGLMPMVLGFGDNRAESEERNNDGLIHYQGELGDFWYDPKEFKVTTHESAALKYLHYVGNSDAVDLPKGCISTRYMFRGCILPEGFTIGNDFDTSEVVDMQGMFQDCEMPVGFSLGINLIQVM